MWSRALRSVREIIDYWVICDTGSKDSTMVEVLTALSGIPGELHRTAWVNFGHNRTRAVQLARGKADYVLVMDADMIANVHAPFKHKLTADCYEIRYKGPIDYGQTMLVSGQHDWSYVGITHEFIHAPTARVRETLPELTLTHFADGGMRTDKFERDVRLLKAALEEDPGNVRNTFYFRPSRLEPMYEIVKRCRETENYRLGYEFGVAFANLPYPKDVLFIGRAVYEHLFPLEFGVCACGTGRISEAVEAFNQVLGAGAIPSWVTESAIRGRGMALRDLYQPRAEFQECSE